MEKLREHYDIDIRWHSFMLRPPGSPPISPAFRARIEDSRPQFVARARTQYGIEINVGPFETNSHPAHIAEKFADTQDKGKALHDAIMDAYWLQAQSIGDQAVLKEIAASVGLNTENFENELAKPEYEAAVEKDVAMAREYGLNAVPALIFADKYLVTGAQPYDLLKQVVEKIQAEEQEA